MRTLILMPLGTTAQSRCKVTIPREVTTPTFSAFAASSLILLDRNAYLK